MGANPLKNKAESEGSILGFPAYFIEATKDASRKSGAVISFRAGQPPKLRKGHRVSPKPSSLKIRTCTSRQGIEILSGFVPVNQLLFGRRGTKGYTVRDALRRVRKELMAENRKAEADKFSAVPLEVTVEEIDTGQRWGLYAPVGGDRTEQIQFSAAVAANNEFIRSKPDRRGLIFRVRTGVDSDPEVFHDVEYVPPSQRRFVSLDIIAYEGWPVTGDADMLAVATPLSAARAMEGLLGEFSFSDLYKAYDTADFAELREVVLMYLLIRHAMDGKPIPVDKIGEREITIVMESAAVKGSGTITPYELLILMLSHEKLARSYTTIAPGSEDLIRHGAETCNPGRISDMDLPMLHIRGDTITITRSQRELVDFYLQPGVLEKNFLLVHPRWNMALWGSVIEKQLQLGQESLMSKDTLRVWRRWTAEQAAQHGGQDIRNTSAIISEIGGWQPFALPAEKTAAAKSTSQAAPEQQPANLQENKNNVTFESIVKKQPR